MGVSPGENLVEQEVYARYLLALRGSPLSILPSGHHIQYRLLFPNPTTIFDHAIRCKVHQLILLYTRLYSTTQARKSTRALRLNLLAISSKRIII
jgi:hypothetical protein